jgi:hypothetical protein
MARKLLILNSIKWYLSHTSIVAHVGAMITKCQCGYIRRAIADLPLLATASRQPTDSSLASLFLEEDPAIMNLVVSRWHSHRASPSFAHRMLCLGIIKAQRGRSI